MRISNLTSSAALLIWVSFCTTHAVAVPIPGLYNTGINDLGTPLALGVSDDHYIMTGPIPGAVAVSKHGLWTTAPAGSVWIAPTNGNVSDPGGNYDYILTFDLTGLDPTSATVQGQWATDNDSEIFLNGVNTGNTRGLWGFTTLLDFTLSSGFVSGINTLEFRVINVPSTALNPTGLLVANLHGETTTATVAETGPGLWLIASLLFASALPRRTAYPASPTTPPDTCSS